MLRTYALSFVLLAGIANPAALEAQTQEASPEEPTMGFEEYEPRSTLVVPQNPRPRAKFPFIDVHSHHRASEMDAEGAAEIIAAMDAMNMAVMVNLSGRSGKELEKGLANMKGRYPERFVLFANVSFEGIDDPDYGERAARQLEEDVQSRRPGSQDLQESGNVHHRRFRPASTHGRSPPGAHLEQGWGIRDPGPHPHRGAGAVF